MTRVNTITEQVSFSSSESAHLEFTALEKKVDDFSTEMIMNQYEKHRSTDSSELVTFAVNKNAAAIESDDLSTEIEDETNIYSLDLNSESPAFSNLLGQKVSHVDVFFLFFAILRLYIQEQHFISQVRKLALLDQIQSMEAAAKAYRSQGQWQLLCGVGAGVFGIVSGLAPIIGKMHGGAILEKFIPIFSKLKEYEEKPYKFFEMISKMSEAGGRVYDSTGRAHQAFSQGTITRHEFNKDKARAEADEEMRRREDINQNFREFRNTIKELLDQQIQSDQQLFNVVR